MKFISLVTQMLIIGMLLLTGCGFPNDQSLDCDHTSSNDNGNATGELACTFEHFNETRDRPLGIEVQENVVIDVDYIADLFSGKMSVEWLDGTGNTLHSHTIEGSESGRFELTLGRAETVQMKMTGSNASGALQYSWNHR